MIFLLVSSIAGYSGKSRIIMAIGLILRKMGYKVGYFKPFGARTAFLNDRIIAAKELFGERMKLAVFNQLGGYKRSYIQSVAGKTLKENGVELIGTSPQDSVLGSLFVSEIEESLNAEFIVRPERDIMVEEVLIGAMSANAAVEHFKGNIEPAEMVVKRAKENGIPVLLVKEDTLKAVAKLEEVMGKARIKGEVKIERIKELIKNYVNVDRIIEILQLQPS